MSENLFSVSKATVIRVSRISRRPLRGLKWPIWSNSRIEIVFKLAESREDLKVYVKNLNLAFSAGQEVGIVRFGNDIVAYVDMVSQNYYYTTENYGVELGLGVSLYWVLIVGALGGFMVYSFQRESSLVELLAPLALVWFIQIILKWKNHFRFKNQLDEFLEQYNALNIQLERKPGFYGSAH